MGVIYRCVLDGSAYDTNRAAPSEGVGRTAHASASPSPDMGGTHRGSDILHRASRGGALAGSLGSPGRRVKAPPNHHRITPGWFDTALNRQAFAGDPGRLRKILSRAPLGRVGDPLDVGHATLAVDPVTGYHDAMTTPTVSRPGLGAPPRSRISNIRHGSLPRRSATDDHTQGPRRR